MYLVFHCGDLKYKYHRRLFEKAEGEGSLLNPKPSDTPNGHAGRKTGFALSNERNVGRRACGVSGEGSAPMLLGMPSSMQQSWLALIKFASIPFPWRVWVVPI
jgi:hypothetical protein